ncbi:MAG: hypothetical protein ACK55I_11090, partial [bacterium]
MHVALVGIHDAKALCVGERRAGGLHAQGSTGEHAKECRIHHRAAVEIDDEAAHAAGHDALEGGLRLHAVLKSALPLHTHPEHTA